MAGVPEPALSGHRIGELKSSAVAPEARGRGIGTQMPQARLTFLRSGVCRYAIAAFWVSADAGHSSWGMLERAGLTQLATIPATGPPISPPPARPAPDCGQACACIAAIMVLDLRYSSGDTRPARFFAFEIGRRLTATHPEDAT
ncbi:MAG: GNAT family N-acetyltransferase [Arthrobacter sp.]